MPDYAALDKPTARIVLLLDVTAGLWCRAWVIDGTHTNSYKVATTLEVTAVRWNQSTLLTQRSSAALVDANVSSWHWDGAILWVRPPGGESIFETTVQAVVSFFWSNHPRIISNRYYDPRLKSCPNLSQRIEPKFGGVGQIGGGDITLVNNDQFFDALMDLQWDAGSIVLKVGIDTHQAEAASYQTMATWAAEDWKLNEQDFKLRVIEPAAVALSKLPIDVYTREEFPFIDTSDIAKPIPIAYGYLYGISPVVINPGAKQFKIAGHAIRDFLEVRVSRAQEETIAADIPTAQWAPYATNVWRYYNAGDTVKNVLFNGASLAEENSIEDVAANDGSWTSQENYVYVRPTSGQTISSGTYTINSSRSNNVWLLTNFASVDRDNAEFTLGDDWSSGDEVAVDFIGKVDIYNAVDVVEDILAEAGRTNLDTASFTTARARLKIGTDERNEDVHERNPGVYISDSEDAINIIGEILANVRGYLYSSPTAQYAIGIFEPTRSEGLQVIDDTDITDLEELQDMGDDHPSSVLVRYAERVQDEYAQIVQRERVSSQYLRNRNTASPTEIDSLLTVEADVIRQADKMLMLEGGPMRTWLITTPWQSFLFKPGDQVHLEYATKGLNRTVEILEVQIDLGQKTVKLLVGDLRSLHDTPGWWVGDSDVLPTRFAAETGYGAGSLVWNASWSDTIKNWVRQNVGHWTDDNGFAATTDAESHYSSTWV